MFRAIPVGNKVINKKLEQQNQSIHYSKLRNMKSTVDSNCPSTFNQLRVKPKKDQIQEGNIYKDRYTEIERENRILLEKMSSIMQNKNKNFKNSELYPKKSLNKLARKRQLMHIFTENQAMLKRLNDKKPSYDIAKWEKERADKEKVLANICEYPYKLGVTDDFRKRNGSVTRNRSVFSRPLKKPRKLEPLENSKVVFKRGMIINDRSFLIEMLIEADNLNISVYDVDNPETFTLEIPIDEAIELMGGKAKYENLAKMLSMENGELVLLELPSSGPKRRSMHDPITLEKEVIEGKLGNSLIEPSIDPLDLDLYQPPEDHYSDDEQTDEPLNMQTLMSELDSLKEDLKNEELTDLPLGVSQDVPQELTEIPPSMSLEESIIQLDLLKSEISS